MNYTIDTPVTYAIMRRSIWMDVYLSRGKRYTSVARAIQGLKMMSPSKYVGKYTFYLCHFKGDKEICR